MTEEEETRVALEMSARLTAQSERMGAVAAGYRAERDAALSERDEARAEAAEWRKKAEEYDAESRRNLSSAQERVVEKKMLVDAGAELLVAAESARDAALARVEVLEGLLREVLNRFQWGLSPPAREMADRIRAALAPSPPPSAEPVCIAGTVNCPGSRRLSVPTLRKDGACFFCGLPPAARRGEGGET